MLSAMMPFVERLVMAVECMSYEVENISLHLKGVSHSLHDLNMNVSSLLKGKTQANISTLSCEGTDPLTDSTAAEEVTVVEDQYSGQYGGEDVSQNHSVRSQQSPGDTPFIDLIESEESHLSNIEYCDEPLGFSPANQVDFAEPTNMLQRIDNLNVTFSEISSAVHFDNETEDSSSKLHEQQSKDQTSIKSYIQNLSNVKRKLTEAIKRNVFVVPISNTKETRKEDNNTCGSKESEEVLREPGNIRGFTYVRDIPKMALEEENARKGKERVDLEPSTSLGRERKSYQKSSFCCETCGKCFPKNSLFETHQRVHTGDKPFTCYLCEKTFSTKGNLVSHMSVHSSEKLFTCNTCGEAFKHRSNLNTHMRIHSGEKPFECGVCLKAFRQNTHLINHLCTHSGERPFSCTDCGKCFTRSASLYRHKNTVHEAPCL